MSDEVNAAGENREEPEQQAMPAHPQIPAGAQLAALREARGWTIEQVASQLNLTGRQVKALEADNYAALPGMVIVRGFIRSYAKLLRADAAPILSAIASEKVKPEAVLQDRGLLSAAFLEGEMPSKKADAASSKILLIVLAVIAVAVFGIVAQRIGWMPNTSNHATNAVQTEEQPIPAQAHAAQPKTPVPVSAPVAATEPAEAQPVAVIKKKQQAAAAPAPAAGNPAPVAVDSKNALVFQIKEDSWVEIRRTDDSILVSRLFKAGTTEAFEITGPSSMVVGNAAGVSATLRGKTLDLIGNSSNVARLSVK